MVDEKLINRILEWMKEYLQTGIIEEPNRFRYSRFVSMMMIELELDLSQIDIGIFNKVLKEFISYIG